MQQGDRLIGYGLIGHRCDIRDVTTGKWACTATANSIIRHRPTGAVVSARCRKHDTATRRAELQAGRCPTCRLPRDWHYDEYDQTYTCDRAINYAADQAERNLDA